MFRNHRKQWGFSMIELLVVTTIIIVLTSVGLVAYNTTSKKTRDGKREADIAQIRSALEIYRSLNGLYPPYPTGGTNNSATAAYYTSLMGDTNFTKHLSSSTIQDPSSPSKVYEYASRNSRAGYQICYTNEAGTRSCLTNP